MTGDTTTRDAIGEPELVVVADPDAASEEAARRIAAALADGIAARGRADFATTGGSTPAGVYQRLESDAHRDSVPWDGVHLWWGDDRFVPRDHRFSNVRIADQILLGGTRYADGAGEAGSSSDLHRVRPPGVPIPLEQVHPFPIGDAVANRHDAAWCAARYIQELRESGIAVADGWPVFDVLFLGVGPDGHVLSVFPHSPAFDLTAWAMPIPPPTHVEPHIERVTLNPGVIGVARLVLVVVHGTGKNAVLPDVFAEQREPRAFPAQLARREGAVWILDEAAAAALPGGVRPSASSR